MTIELTTLPDNVDLKNFSRYSLFADTWNKNLILKHIKPIVDHYNITSPIYYTINNNVLIIYVQK